MVWCVVKSEWNYLTIRVQHSPVSGVDLAPCLILSVFRGFIRVELAAADTKLAASI
jgi:hypothetical protein